MSRHTDDDAARSTPATGPLRVTSALPWRDAGWRSPVDLLALAATVAAFWLVADTPGALAGGGLVIAYLLVPPVAVFAGGVVAATALVPAGTPPVVAVPVAPLVVLLVTTPAESTAGGRLRHAVALVGAGAVLGGVAALALVLTDAVWLAGLALLLAGAAGHVSVDLMSLSRVGATDE